MAQYEFSYKPLAPLFIYEQIKCKIEVDAKLNVAECMKKLA